MTRLRSRVGAVARAGFSIARTVLVAAEPVLKRIASVGLIPSGVVLAAQTFMALFPLLIGIIALVPVPVANTIVATMRGRFGLDGITSDEATQLIASRDQLQGGFTAIGLIVVLASATSFTRALQRTYENAWAIPRLGLRGSIRGLEWLIGIVIYILLLSLTLELTKSHALIIMAIRGAVIVGGTAVVWWMTPFVLLCGRVRLRALVPTGALTAIAGLVAGRVSAQIMPRIIQRNETQFGTIGAVFAIQSWLVVIGTIIVAAAILGALAAQAGGPIGRWSRGTGDRDGWQREKPPSRLMAKLTRRFGSAIDAVSPTEDSPRQAGGAGGARSRSRR